MTTRANAQEETRARILREGRKALFNKYFDEFTLQEIAEAARVTVQTVLRHFASKEGLVEAVKDDVGGEIWTRMDAVPVGDVRAAIAALHERYEWMGDGNIRLLAQEPRVKPIADGLREARTRHREWVERIFAPYLPPKRHPNRQMRLLQFLVLCDVYTWKLLRRDHGGNRKMTMRTILELMEPLVRPDRMED